MTTSIGTSSSSKSRSQDEMNKLRRKVLESLPQELRDNVYAHLWEDTPLYYPILFEMSAETDRNRPNIELRPDFILGTDDTTIQFAAEAAAYFYSSLYVPDLDMPLYKSQDLTWFMQEDVFSVGLTPANFPLRSMIIRINLGDHDYTPGTKYGLRNARELKNVLKCLKDPQLRRDFKVDILLHSNRGPGDVDALWSLYQITHVLTSAIQVLSDQGVNVSIVYSAVRWSGGKMEHNFEATKITGVSVEGWIELMRQVTEHDIARWATPQVGPISKELYAAKVRAAIAHAEYGLFRMRECKNFPPEQYD